MDLQKHSIVRNVDVAGPLTISTLNPATGEEIASVSALDAEGAVDAVSAAKEAFPGWSQTPVEERQRLIGRWLQIMLEEKDDLARLVSMEGGKPVTEAHLVDVFPGLETLSYYAENLGDLLAFRPVKPRQLMFAHWEAGYRFDPLGVLAVITPWNYPVGIPMAELVPAVGAGNTVVFKPASATVLIGLALGDMARRAGFPPGVINTVALPGAATDAVLDHPDVVKVLFTGSVEIGRHVARRCAERLVPAQLELGGKDAAVVVADAHLERAARGLVWGAFVNTGQTCASIERAYVERPIFDRLLSRVVELTKGLRVGDPSQPNTDMGPLTTRGQRDLVARQVEAALADGARALTGGEMPDGPGFFYPPTVLVDVTDDMEIMHEETFGPVLPMVPVADIEEAVRRANDSKFGLTASGWTRSRATAERLQRELDAGVVTINDHAVAFGETTGSWGGVRESGIGRAHGEFGLHDLVNVKYVMRDPGDDRAMPWYYPYDEDCDAFLGAALPMMYGEGLGKFSTLGDLAMTKRFRSRVRKGTLIANLDKLL
ncbi:MAG: aldehyde dehydrogenase family protein [Acidobacteriota bacterium]|nr:aldehyde dehydrogenase family protein [Acidobacteriota bacterium]